MIAWYSPARSSFSSWIIFSRVIVKPAVVCSLVIMFLKLTCGFHARLHSVFHGEADFDGHLPVIHLSFVDVAARFDHLKPAQVLDGFVRTLNGSGNSVLDGSGGGAGELDEFIDWVFHTRFFRYRKRTIEN